MCSTMSVISSQPLQPLIDHTHTFNKSPLYFKSLLILCHLHFIGCHFVRHFYMKANLDTPHLVRTSCAPLKLSFQLLSSLPPSPIPMSTCHPNAIWVAPTLPATMRSSHATKSIPMTIRSSSGIPS